MNPPGGVSWRGFLVILAMAVTGFLVTTALVKRFG